MEGDGAEAPLLHKSNSFTPQATRPKLPPFAGAAASTSPTSDQGQGRVEIKAIMEDILNLQKKDWKTYSRSGMSTLPRMKSVSTNSSPDTSPRFGTPVGDNGKSRLSRDRSHSLKILTSKLMSKNSKPVLTQDSSGSGMESTKEGKDAENTHTEKHGDVSNVSTTASHSKHSSAVCAGSDYNRKSTEKTHDKIIESPEDVEHEEAQRPQVAISEEESYRKGTELHDSQTTLETSGDSDLLETGLEKSSDSEGSSIRSHEDAAKSKLLKDKIAEDEGLGESGEHLAPFVSTYIYHPIPRKSKFLQLAATKPPKRFPPDRRSGLTTLTHCSIGAVGRSGSDDLRSYESHSSDEQSHHRPHRRSESVSLGVQKLPPRFITHPPAVKSSHGEPGAVDSNGFGALRSTPSWNDEGKTSEVSLADSQLASELSEGSSYQDMADMVKEENNNDYLNLKNEKPAQLKFKSDSLGEQATDSFDSSSGSKNSQSQISPVLSDENSSGVIHVQVDEYEKADHDSSVSGDTSLCVLGEDHNSCGEDEDRENVDVTQNPDRSPGEETPSLGAPEDAPPQEPIFTISRSPTPGPSMVLHQPSPTPLPLTAPERPSNLLSVPHASSTSRKQNIFRSASSGVLQTIKPVISPSQEMDPSRKFSIILDESIVGSKTGAPDFLPIGDTVSNATSMPSVWNRENIYSSSDSPEREPGFVKDKRYHIVEELYKNEREYVEALRTLKDKYMIPLKTLSNVDDNIVDSIFYMIPEILTHHSIYLDFLDNVWKHWDTATSTVGNIIVNTFSKQTVLESYMSFVENYNASGKEIEHALNTKSSVQKFIEQCQRDSGSKLSMKDLIVRPIQRIPRYELLIQRLLDNTPQDHPDYPLLQQACRVMHDLAVKIGTVNNSQHGEDVLDTLKKLELLLMTDLANPDRAYIRHDMVQLFTKKDQCFIWLFSDVLIISSIKRKSGPVTRKVSIILKTQGGQDFIENIKHKVILRVGLDDVEIVKTQGQTRRMTVDKEQVEEDLQVVTQMAELAGKLSCQHQGLEEVIKELNSNLSRQLVESNIKSCSPDSNKLELLVTTQEGVLHLLVGFASAEKKALWEAAFTEAKQKLASLTDKRAPEFLQPLQITKTRAGMQFSCAAPIDGVNANGYRDVWVCNSDGYVGHMCLLSLQPEPIVTLNTPVPGCNARILCICAVPAFLSNFRRRMSQKGVRGPRNSISIAAIPERSWINSEKNSSEFREVSPSDERADSGLDKNNDTPDSTSITPSDIPSDLMASDSAASIEANDSMENSTEDVDQTDSDSSDDDPVSLIPRAEELFLGPGQFKLLLDEGPKKPKVSELTENSPDPITTLGSWEQDPGKSTMWLGTEDGCIHIFQSCDNIKTTKNKLKIQHGSPVQCIIYLDNKVFVSLANGDLIVYKRDQEGLWDTECPYTRTIGSAASPITKMLAVAGKLWCGCQNQIYVVNPLTFSVEMSFSVSSDSAKAVQCLVSSGQGVWLTCQQSSKVMLFHAVTYEFLLEVSVAQAVGLKLQSADDIIRQHKAACLRITALLTCKDLLWVGTSAGVILTIPVPRITSTTTRGSLATPTVTGLVYGHTGHVRFLTSVEISSSSAPKSETLPSVGEGHILNEQISIQDLHRRSSIAATTATMASRMLVISGGDGYEDFRNTTSNEGAGRDDSTNHLLLWQV